MMPQQQQVCRPVASNDTRSGPLAALINAMSSGANQGHFSQCGKDASFNQTLRDALNLQSNSLFANMQRGLAGVPKDPMVKSEILAGESSGACSQGHFPSSFRDKDPPSREPNPDAADSGNADPESSNEGNVVSCLLSDRLRQPLISEEAKKKRRQEINRESARRVRKRKTEAQMQLQEEVMALKSAASSTAADQAVIVRYAAEVTKERDGLLQRSANLEAKWITAECKNVILRQRIADLTGVSLQHIAADTGQILPTELHPKPSETQALITPSAQFNAITANALNGPAHLLPLPLGGAGDLDDPSNALTSTLQGPFQGILQPRPRNENAGA